MKFLGILCAFGILLCIQILIMIHGWGLTPVSWIWILVGGIIGSFFAYYSPRIIHRWFS